MYTLTSSEGRADFPLHVTSPKYLKHLTKIYKRYERPYLTPVSPMVTSRLRGRETRSVGRPSRADPSLHTSAITPRLGMPTQHLRLTEHVSSPRGSSYVFVPFLTLANISGQPPLDAWILKFPLTRVANLAVISATSGGGSYDYNASIRWDFLGLPVHSEIKTFPQWRPRLLILILSCTYVFHLLYSCSGKQRRVKKIQTGYTRSEYGRCTTEFSW